MGFELDPAGLASALCPAPAEASSVPPWLSVNPSFGVDTLTLVAVPVLGNDLVDIPGDMYSDGALLTLRKLPAFALTFSVALANASLPLDILSFANSVTGAAFAGVRGQVPPYQLWRTFSEVCDSFVGLLSASPLSGDALSCSVGAGFAGPRAVWSVSGVLSDALLACFGGVSACASDEAVGLGCGWFFFALLNAGMGAALLALLCLQSRRKDSVQRVIGSKMCSLTVSSRKQCTCCTGAAGSLGEAGVMWDEG